MQAKRTTLIADVLKALEEGNLIPSFHAQQQMKKRDILISDLEEAIYQAHREENKDSLTNDKKDWKYSLRGRNSNNDKDLRIIVVFDDIKVVVITVIDKIKKDNV